jgi:CspA family cold shock protein
MALGTIKKIVGDKGFGFIQGEHGELFFHRSSVQGIEFGALKEGQRVSYAPGRGPPGPRAEDVRAA